MVGRIAGVCGSLGHSAGEWVKGRVPLGSWLPAHWRAVLGVVLALFMAAGAVARFSAEVTTIWWEFYGPDVVLGVLPAPPVSHAYGANDLLNEYTFKHGIVREVQDERDLMDLFDSPSRTTIEPFRCPGNGASRVEPDLYKISTVSQNLGHRTAERYQMTVTFTSNDRRRLDPGVRILYVGGDDLRLSYLYQHDTTRKRPDCLPDMDKQWNVSPFSRQTYDHLGLTRDMAVMTGSLPAKVFQTIEIVAYVPCASRRFAALFQVQCPNCRFFYRLISLAQILELPDTCARSGVPLTAS
jgi:hypothetical protein